MAVLVSCSSRAVAIELQPACCISQRPLTFAALCLSVVVAGLLPVLAEVCTFTTAAADADADADDHGISTGDGGSSSSSASVMPMLLDLTSNLIASSPHSNPHSSSSSAEASYSNSIAQIMLPALRITLAASQALLVPHHRTLCPALTRQMLQRVASLHGCCVIASLQTHHL
jgi:uncharacterized protein YjeT (DUF2065 family)